MDVAWRLLFLGRTMSHLRCLASTGLVLSACVAAPTDPVDPPVQPAPVWLDQADGTYQTITTVSVEADAPATTLRAYVDAPGSTLLAAAADADAPALALLEASLPPGVAALLPGYLDEVLRSNGVALLTAWSLAVVVQRLPTSAQLEGELVLDGETARHAVHAISFADAGAPARRFELGLRGDEVTAIATAVTATPSGSGGYLVLGPESARHRRMAPTPMRSPWRRPPRRRASCSAWSPAARWSPWPSPASAPTPRARCRRR